MPCDLARCPRRNRPTWLPQPAGVVQPRTRGNERAAAERLDVAENMQQRLDRSCRWCNSPSISDACKRLIVVPCPKIPDDATIPRATTMREALLA
ncbi:MAG: hypothetical protein U0792_24335 [Gemmataceae bacterium]